RKSVWYAPGVVGSPPPVRPAMKGSPALSTAMEVTLLSGKYVAHSSIPEGFSLPTKQTAPCALEGSSGRYAPLVPGRSVELVDPAKYTLPSDPTASATA